MLHDDMIQAHLLYLRSIGNSKNTAGAADALLHRLERDLPAGLVRALPHELEEWLARDPDWTPQTRETYRLHICRFFRWATRPADPWIDYDPAAELAPIPVPAGVARPATDEQVRVCCTETATPWRLHCVLAAYAGLRPCEIARLHREHVTATLVTVIRGKGGRSRVVPTHPAIWRLVEPMPAGRVTRQPDRRPATASWVSKRTGEVLRRRHKLPIALYNLRHWYGTTVQEAQGDLRVTQELMGHSSPTTTMIYTRVTDVRLRAAVAALPAPEDLRP